MTASSTRNQENGVPKESPPLKKFRSEVKSKDSDPSKPSKNAKSKAKLSLLPSLPLDVLFEIFGHLPPLSLLHLTRTTKDLRRVLMHRSAVSIWKTSLGQISGVPTCPMDMAEPAWANLVFSPYCHNCHRRAQKVDWVLRLRLCEPCVKSSDILRSDKHLDSAKKLDKIVLQCVPFTSTFRIRGHKGKCCLAEDERTFLKALSLLPGGDKSEFVKGRKEALVTREKHAAECTAWVESTTQDRWDQLEAIRQQRRDDIANKLEELGFIEELEYLEGLEGCYGLRPPLRMFDEHPDVKVNKPLTQRSWDAIEERLVKYMHEVKEHQKAADRLRVVRKREKVAISAWIQFRLQFPPEMLLPSGSDILSWDEIKAIVELPSDVPTKEQDDTSDASHGNPETPSPRPERISPASFTRVFHSKSTFVSKWRDKQIRELGLRSMVGPHILFSFYPPSVHLTTLQLAACVFSCEDRQCIHQWIDHCDKHYPAMWYPEFIHHPCNTVKRAGSDADKSVPLDPSFKPSKDFPFPCFQRMEWSADSVFFDEKASRAVKRVLEACGLDYRTVTTEEMDEMDPWFICLKCSYGAKCDGQRSRKVMPWRNAVQHCMLVHWGDGAVTWERVTDESAAKARTLSAACSIGTNIWRCAHCRDSPEERVGKKTEQLMKTHLDESHNITGGVKDRDYYKAVDCPPPIKTSVQMTPKTVENVENE